MIPKVEMKNIFAAVIFSALFLCAAAFALEKNEKGNITVICGGFRNDKGMAMISLFTSKEGFPGKYEKAFRNNEARILDGKAAFIFKGVPYGAYAVSVYHDENDNKKMDTSWFGIPKEGVGASNNPKTKFGPPSFNKAKFNFNTPELTLNIETRYVE